MLLLGGGHFEKNPGAFLNPRKGINPFATDSFFENAPKFEELSMRNAAPRQHITQQQQWWRSRSYLLLLQVSHGLSQSLTVSRSLYPPHYVFSRRARHE